MTTNKVIQTIIIPSDHQNERVDQALAKLMPDFSRTQIKEWLENGMILVNGNTTRPKTKLYGGETVTVHATLKPQPAWEPQNISLNIVHEDDDILIINKPRGLVVHPGAGNHDSTLLNALIYHAPALKELPRAGILHRLDKDTSGLLVIAKNPGALNNLSQQLKNRTLVREYQAIVNGVMISGGTVNAPMARNPHNRKRMAVVDNGKIAITHYRVAEKFRAHTRLNIRLETGRTHQIRVHMAHIHHAVVGDKTYGGRLHLAKGMSQALIDKLRHYNRQALHAYGLTLVHPRSEEEMRFEVEVADDIKELIQALREDAKL